MSVPDPVSAQLGDEEVLTQVSLGGDDQFILTPTRFLVYRADGIISDASVEEYSLEAEAVTVRKKRRSATLVLDYGLDGEQSLSINSKALDTVLHTVLAGILHSSGLIDSDEQVLRALRFSELTLIITSKRLFKHVGEVVWDEEYDEIPFESVLDLDVEDGRVGSQFVVRTDGGSDRFKIPTDDARMVRELLQSALTGYHGLDTWDAFQQQVAPAEPKQSSGGSEAVEDMSSLKPLMGTNDTVSETKSSRRQQHTTDDVEHQDLLRELRDLRQSMETLERELTSQRERIERAIEATRKR